MERRSRSLPIRSRLALLAWSAAGGGSIILLHLLVPSLLNFYHWSPSFARWQNFLAHIVDLHARIVGPFITRPVTTFVIQSLSAITDLSPWWGFVLAQFVLLTAAGYALCRLSERLMSPPQLSLAAFFLSFTVLFSFVTPNDSYDEAAQYLFLFLGLGALVSGRDFSFALFFFLALLTRETSALLLPGLLLLGWSGRKTAWKFALPLALFALYYFSRDAAPDPNRFHYWAKNFQTGKIALESLVSLFLALALPLALCAATRRFGLMRAHGPWVRAFFLAATLNTAVVFTTAYARESRLLALPLVFLWPLGGAWIERLRQIRRERGFLFAPLSAPALLALAAALGCALFYRPAYRFPGGYEILAPAYFLLLFVGFSLRPGQPASH